MDGQQQQIVVDLMPPQYTKPTTPPPSPPINGMHIQYSFNFGYIHLIKVIKMLIIERSFIEAS